MEETGNTIRQEAAKLLREWCGGLLRYQLDRTGAPEFDGGILCPACKMIHGRCAEAVYPLLCASDLTGEKRFLFAAQELFRWSDNLRCDDGGYYNDANSQWKGTTVFYAIALHDALFYHGRLLTAEEKTEWEARLSSMGGWLHQNLAPGDRAYLNYYAANACAMALLGRYFGREDWLALARKLSDLCLSHVTESGLLYGEAYPHGKRSHKGCAAVDLGYDAEETLPCLLRCAETLRDEAALRTVKTLFRTQLDWMLPDGAWDNSLGTRSFKWTWWGGRTTDGCLDALFRLGKDEPVFAEAAARRLSLLRRCTENGLLYGGPDLAGRGEPPCVHHTFCRAKPLAAVLDGAIPAFTPTPLPCETADGIFEYPELAAYRLIRDGWVADITANDFTNRKGWHASGGAISLLWHRDCGPIVAVGMADYTVNEPFNQQQTTDTAAHRSPCPRIEAAMDGKRWAQHYDHAAQLTAREEKNALKVHADAYLCDGEHTPKDVAGTCSLDYALTKQALNVKGRVSPALADHAVYVLPLIAKNVSVDVSCGTLLPEREEGFCLNPGFSFTEYRIRPDRHGRFAVGISPKAPEGAPGD